MKRQKLATKLLAVLLLVFAGCCSGSTVKQTLLLLIDLGRAGKYVTVTVTNVSQKAERLPGLAFALSKGAPGLYLSIDDASGKLHTMCAMIDQVDTGDYVVPPRGYLLTNLSIGFLKRVYCLPSGTYTMTAIFAVGNGMGVESAPMTVTVK